MRFFLGYEKCATIFQRKAGFRFLQQKTPLSFREDLLSLIHAISDSRLAFLVDDDIFIRPFGAETFDRLNLREYVPSLRLGRNITYSYMQARTEELPKTLKQDDGLLYWEWRGNDVDWSYPLSVDGHIFLKKELEFLARRIRFTSPNTLEAALQEFAPLFLSRRGVCFEMPRLVNLPLNKVQTDFDNRHGLVSAEYLLTKWEAGFAIDIERLCDIDTNSVHIDIPIPLTRRPE